MNNLSDLVDFQLKGKVRASGNSGKKVKHLEKLINDYAKSNLKKKK